MSSGRSKASSSSSADAAAVDSNDDEAYTDAAADYVGDGIPRNTKIKVYWTGERRWFVGVVDDVAEEDGKRIHHVTYNDGDTKWHHLPSEWWLQVPETAKEKAAKAKAKAEAEMRAAERAAAERAAAERAAAERAVAERAVAERAVAERRTSSSSTARRKKRPRPQPKQQSPWVDASVPSNWVSHDVVPVVETVPPLSPVSARTIEHLPMGVVKLSGFLSDELRQRLYDTVMIAGWDHRVSGSYADSVYTNAAGAPNILLHYNYYSSPSPDQPPPMGVLQIADAVHRAYREMEAAEAGIRPPDEQQQQPQPSVSQQRATPTAASTQGGGANGGEADRTVRRARRTRSGSGGAPAPPNDAEYEAELLEQRKARCKFPADPDFQSVLALGYQATDSFRWHTDMAGDDGWLCSISLGATATFEYLPQIAMSARDRIEAHKQLDPVSVQVGCGDCLLFHGGYLPHRITHCEAVPSEAFARMSAGNSIARMNLQCRVFGASAGHGLHSLLQLAGAVPISGGTTRDGETASSRDGDTESTVSVV